MKKFISLLAYSGLALTLVVGATFSPWSFDTDAQASGSSRLVQGPLDFPLSSEYLTETSNIINPDLDDLEYALPAVNQFNYVNIGSYYYYSPVHMDMNGDGLLDMVYSKVDYGGYPPVPTKSEQYVMLNTGSAFDLVYVCYYYSTSNPKYQGDCADPS